MIKYFLPFCFTVLFTLDKSVAQNNAIFATGSGSGYSRGCVGTVTEVNLPVELLTFSAIVAEDGVQLNWTTSVQINNDYFTIQRSGDGEIFSDIGRVKGAGTYLSSLDYRFLDGDPLYGNGYYRLKQTDFDGMYTFSAIIGVKFITDKVTLNGLFPNPVIDILNCSIYGLSESTIWYTITDVAGKNILGKVENINRGINTIILNTSGLSKGVYILKISSPDGMIIEKFIK